MHGLFLHFVNIKDVSGNFVLQYTTVPINLDSD